MLRHALLGLLSESDGHGWELHARFEKLLADTWPVNNGQVYATLQRLERNGLVEARTVEQDDRPDRHVYRITDSGQAELERWLREPPPKSGLLKDEFFLKVLVRCVRGETGSSDIDGMLHAQRQHYYDALASITERRMDPSLNVATQLLLDGATRRLEADLHWLDDVEQRLGDIGSGARQTRQDA